jgi:hypothetical protein
MRPRRAETLMPRNRCQTIPALEVNCQRRRPVKTLDRVLTFYDERNPPTPARAVPTDRVQNLQRCRQNTGN